MKKHIAFALAFIMTAMSFALTACSKKSTELDDYDLDDYVNVCEYRGVKIPSTVITVDDDDVATEVNKWLKTFADTVDLKEGDVVQLNDTVKITYHGYIKGEYENLAWGDGEEFTKNESGYDLGIGSGSFIPGFETSLIGYHIGEEYEFDIKFPDTYKKNPDLEGVTVTFKGEIKSGKRDVLPEYTDAFVAEKTDYNTIKDYEAYIMTELRAAADEKETLEEVAAVWTYIMDKSSVIKYPEAVVEARVEEAKETYRLYAESLGSTLDELVASENMSMDSFEAYLKGECEQLVFEEMVLKVIIDREGMSISDAEYVDGLADYAKDNGFSTPQACEEYYGEDVIRESLLWDKVFLFLVEKAEITDETTAETTK